MGRPDEGGGPACGAVADVQAAIDIRLNAAAGRKAGIQGSRGGEANGREIAVGAGGEDHLTIGLSANAHRGTGGNGGRSRPTRSEGIVKNAGAAELGSSNGGSVAIDAPEEDRSIGHAND